jgi:hypothetical protein
MTMFAPTSARYRIVLVEWDGLGGHHLENCPAGRNDVETISIVWRRSGSSFTLLSALRLMTIARENR